jgi:hypothetical protein
MDEFVIIQEVRYEKIPLLLFPIVIIMDVYSDLREELRKTNNNIFYRRYVERKLDRIQKKLYKVQHRKKYWRSLLAREKKLTWHDIPEVDDMQKWLLLQLKDLRKSSETSQMHQTANEKYDAKVRRIFDEFFALAVEDERALQGLLTFYHFVIVNFAEPNARDEKKMQTTAEFVKTFQVENFDNEQFQLPTCQKHWDQEIYEDLILHIRNWRIF